MPVVNGMVTSYDVPSNARDVSDAFPLISLPDTPLLNRISLSGVATARKREWWNDALQITSGKLAAGYTAGALALVLATEAGVRVGMVAMVDDTVYRVTAINTGTHTLTVVKVSAAADANHASGALVEYMGVAALEGADYEDSDWTLETKDDNVCQIFNDFVNMSGTELAVNKEIPLPDELDRQIDRKMKRQYQFLDKALWRGYYVDAADKTQRRIMGGVTYYIKKAGVAGSGTFTKDNLNAWLLDLKNKGGKVKTLWMNPTDLAQFSGLDAAIQNQDISSTRRGTFATEYLTAQGDLLQLVPAQNCRVGTLWCFEVEDVNLMPLQGRAFQVQDLSKTGDSTKTMLIGEYTCEVRNPATMGYYVIG